MNAGVLLVCCVAAMIWPVGGIAILLVLTSSLFNLYQYATVPLPLGYVGPTEAILLCVLGRLFWTSWQRSAREQNDDPDMYEGFAIRTLVSAVVPYVLWQTLCCIRGAMIWQGTEHFRFALRFIISGVFTWALVAAVWMMRRQVCEILWAVLILTGMTALLHITIQILDYRSLMAPAYWISNAEYDFVTSSLEQGLWKADIVRGLPQGIFLMVCSLIYVFAGLLAGMRLHGSSGYSWFFVAVQTLAIGITVTRSVAMYALMGCVFAVIFTISLRLHPIWIILSRLIIGILLMAFAFTVYATARPGFMDFWKERTQQLIESTDHKILSEENEARGKDNVASLNAILDHPIFGCGTPRYPDEYSLREVPATDIHPLLEIGLVGGVPAIVLILRLQWIVFWRFWRATRELKEHQHRLLGHFSIIAVTGLVINLCGAGGTLSGFGLITMALFVGLMAAEFATPGEDLVADSVEARAGIAPPMINMRGPSHNLV